VPAPPNDPATAEQGSLSVELVLLVVPLVTILLFLVALGRLASARNQVEEAARDAARAASTASSPMAARAGAVAAADADLSGISCADRSIVVDTSDLVAGGQVAVTVGCHVPLGDLPIAGMAGRRTVQARSVAVVDSYAQR
jgi:Flp pilus assembly protein TadG